MVDSSVTLCNDLQVLNFSFDNYCEVRYFYDWIADASADATVGTTE